MQTMGKLSIHSKCLDFFPLSFREGGGGCFPFSFVPNMFPSNSQWVPIRFPICSPRVFLIAPRFNLICFAQSPLLLTYIGRPKGEALHLSIESSLLGSLHSFKKKIGHGPIKLAHYQIFFKKKVGLVMHPQLINMKQAPRGW